MHQSLNWRFERNYNKFCIVSKIEQLFALLELENKFDSLYLSFENCEDVMILGNSFNLSSKMFKINIMKY